MSPIGSIVAEQWEMIPTRFPGVELDIFVVMPNHVHGIIVLPDFDLTITSRPSLGQIVRAFKATSARLARKAGFTSFAWQPNYYERVIRSEWILDRARRYVVENPMRWELDEENPIGDHLGSRRTIVEGSGAQ